MKAITRAIRSGILLGGIAAFTWTQLLDNRAKASLKRAGMVSADLAAHLIEEYTGTTLTPEKPDTTATERNKAWVEEQWRRAGY